MGRRIVCGDIHGNVFALRQCLERSKFDYEKDQLITIGDLVDGWKYVYEVIEELLKIKNRIDIRGNHDDWFIDFLKDDYSKHPTMWDQGAEGTLASYCRNLGFNYEIISKTWDDYHQRWITKCATDMKNTDVPQSHRDLFLNMKLHHSDFKNNFFVHGGFDRNQYIDYLTFANPTDFYWNRSLWEKALCFQDNGEDNDFFIAENFKQIFIGHSCTLKWDQTSTPMHAAKKIWNVDTGAGWYGRLTFMDVDTFEYWQSDTCKEIFKDETTTR